MKYIYVLLTATLLASCANPNAERIEALKKETIAIHDTVMPRLGELVELGMQMKAKRSSLEADTATSHDSVISVLNDRIVFAQRAHDGMMDWMAEYDPTHDKEHNDEETIAYYEEQRMLIKQVKRDMENGIEDAKEIIGKN